MCERETVKAFALRIRFSVREKLNTWCVYDLMHTGSEFVHIQTIWCDFSARKIAPVCKVLKGLAQRETVGGVQTE